MENPPEAVEIRDEGDEEDLIDQEQLDEYRDMVDSLGEHPVRSCCCCCCCCCCCLTILAVDLSLHVSFELIINFLIFLILGPSQDQQPFHGG